jgi:hypothetical protein
LKEEDLIGTMLLNRPPDTEDVFFSSLHLFRESGDSLLLAEGQRSGSVRTLEASLSPVIFSSFGISSTPFYSLPHDLFSLLHSVIWPVFSASSNILSFSMLSHFCPFLQARIPGLRRSTHQTTLLKSARWLLVRVIGRGSWPRIDL